ncbi:hypothetical protein FAI40_03795 [Acetobacteraceae bacterium]|nr:hypothetical protein FAI40_03795 [Acetobacteraceae bacterium]
MNVPEQSGSNLEEAKKEASRFEKAWSNFLRLLKMIGELLIAENPSKELKWEKRIHSSFRKFLNELLGREKPKREEPQKKRFDSEVSNLDEVKKELKSFLTEKKSENFVLTGNWGTGKTRLWKDVVAEAQRKVSWYNVFTVIAGFWFLVSFILADFFSHLFGHFFK